MTHKIKGDCFDEYEEHLIIDQSKDGVSLTITQTSFCDFDNEMTIDLPPESVEELLKVLKNIKT